MLTEYELEQLRAAYEKSVNGTAASQYEQEEYVLYGTYEPLSVTITHIINNKSRRLASPPTATPACPWPSWPTA